MERALSTRSQLETQPELISRAFSRECKCLYAGAQALEQLWIARLGQLRICVHSAMLIHVRDELETRGAVRSAASRAGVAALLELAQRGERMCHFGAREGRGLGAECG